MSCKPNIRLSGGFMVRWMLVAAVIGFTAFSLHGEEEENVPVEEKRETASVEKKGSAEVEKKDSRQTMKRRWTKKTKPGSPKARKVPPGRKARVSSDGLVGFEEEMVDEEELPVDEGKSG
jgi:hypothetical protein